MENNEMNLTNANTENSETPANKPKPIRKLVRIQKPDDPNVNPADYQGSIPDNFWHDDPSRTPGRYEADPGEYRGKYAEEMASKYRGRHDPVMDEYMGKYGSTDEDYVYTRADAGEPHPILNIAVKVLSVAMSIVLIGAMILNLPICLDSKTDKNASIIYLIKHWTPANKEGTLDKNTEIINTIVDQVVYEEPEFNDGLDLPQIIEGQYSVLFLGFEPDAYNTDVMWVFQFDIGHGTLNILQIPRDTCLPDYTSSPAKKFNSIYSMGDPNITPPIQRTVNAVQENFGIPIDAYVTVTCPDIVEIIDLIGGVPIHLENKIIFEADKIIPAGDVVLSGQQSEWFIRFRSEWIQGDIGRMQNQRRFMSAAMKKLLNIVEDEGRLKLYSYIKQIFDRDLLYTDMSVDDLSKLADFASTISMEDATVTMVPGEDATLYADDGNEYSVYSVHKQATIDMLNKHFRPYQVPMGIYDTAIVELVENYTHTILDNTEVSMDELQTATEPIRDPNKHPEWDHD